MNNKSCIPAIILANVLVWGIGIFCYGGHLSQAVVWRIVGEFFSTLAITFVAASMMLSTRSKRMDKWFGGLERMYVLHCNTAYAAICCILCHLALLLGSSGPATGKVFGYIAFVIILAGVFMAVVPIFNKYFNFEKWGKEHKLVGLFFVIASVHAVMMPGIGKRMPVVFIFSALCAFAGFAAWVYNVLIYPRIKRVVKYNVEDGSYIGAGLVSVKMKPKNGKIKFQSGQYAFFSFSGYRPREQYPFTLCTSPEEDEIRIEFDETSDYTVDLYDKLEAGMEAVIEGPFGQFVQSNFRENNQIWIAEGPGIVVFEAMARHTDGKNVVLYWAVKDEKSAACLPELRNIAAKNENFKVVPWSMDEKGFPSIDQLEIGNPGDKAFLICCQENHRKDLTAQLKEKGVNPKRIYADRFTFR